MGGKQCAPSADVIERSEGTAMDQQKTFDYPRAAKLRTLERAAMSGAVKSVLKALDGFARDNPEWEATLRSIAVSMGVSESTARRAVREAQNVGVLEVRGTPKNGRMNIYKILWEVVFALPDAMAKSKPENTPEYPILTPTKIDETPTKWKGYPCQNGGGTPVKLEGDPCQVGRGTPVRLTGVSATDHTDQITATIRHGVQTDGGGDCLVRSQERKSGWWVWEVTKQMLGDEAELKRIFDAAVAAGLVEDQPVYRVRVLALANKIRNTEKIKSPTGQLAWMIETGNWNYLPRDAIVRAYRKMYGQEPTGEQIAKIKTATPSPGGVQ